MASPFAGLTASDYAGAAARLFPRGRAWLGAAGGVLDSFRNALGGAAAILHDAAIGLIDTELNPFTADLTLPMWEEDFGLPDPCVGPGQTVQQRQAALVARIQDPGGLNPQRYVDLAASVGYRITITEFTPFQVGSVCGAPVYGSDWKFAWQVNAPPTTVQSVFRCDSTCDEFLQSFGNAELECLIKSRNRPSRIVLFAYSQSGQAGSLNFNQASQSGLLVLLEDF